jgi:hypothetical protein
MSETMDDLKRDIRKDPAELEREADMARDALEDTLFELEQRFSPSELYDRFSSAVKENGGEFGTNLLTQVRSNPVPTIMAGIGLAWLMASSKQPPAARPRDEHTRGLTDKLSSAMDSVRGAAQSARETVFGAAEGARETVYGAAENARETVHGAADSAREHAHGAADFARNAASATTQVASRAADAARRTSDSLRRASSTGTQSIAECYSYLAREQPLMLGAIAIVAGAAIGALLPGTRTEDEWIGETSDAAKSRLKSEAKQRLDDLQETGAQVADAARETLTGSDGGEASADSVEMHASSR